MATKIEKTAEQAIDIQEIKMGHFGAWIKGTSPLIMHRFANKAWRELILPGPKKNAAERASTLKHDPLTEFRECCYRNRDPKEPTLFHYPSGAFSKAIAAAALDLPGASRTQILRLVAIKSVQINVFGIPLMGMDMVRSSDMARTPDVRTRAYFPDWCCYLEIQYVSSLIGQKQVMNLLGAAGQIVGIGDYRPQKGGAFGKFEMCREDEAALKEIRKQTRRAQEAALEQPAFFNEDAAELYAWFVEEVERREKTAELASRREPVQPRKRSTVVPNTSARRTPKARTTGKRKAA